jgi:hypothetical protein
MGTSNALRTIPASMIDSLEARQGHHHHTQQHHTSSLHLHLHPQGNTLPPSLYPVSQVWKREVGVLKEKRRQGCLIDKYINKVGNRRCNIINV